LRGLSLSFGGLSVLQDLDIAVGKDEIVSVIGPNGAGKTTLFNVITGLYKPDEGEILFDGQKARDRAHVPDAAAVPEHVGEGERDGRAVRPHTFRPASFDAANARDAP
jgi:ABC-type branched-subunit amino acid transport system ATPase component